MAVTKRRVHTNPQLAKAKLMSAMEAHQRPNPFTKPKLTLLTIALAVCAVLCYIKAVEIREEVEEDWKLFDIHCHGVENPSDECAKHLIHIRHDENTVNAFEKAGIASALLSAGGLIVLMVFTPEQLASTIL
eukprot:TRINITY_DN46595_c0_g1_i1.p1 TRINITY_DN46595_c0_g1~~TRINITY_DN46595_c0_g1_i1.p1  ORF type:complete len:150 (+),score=33.28 TRINITY_DN46595_c0_g1_i1:56-451(+)